MKNETIDKCAERGSPQTGSTGVNLKSSEDGAVAAVHDNDDRAKIFEVEKEEQYEGDDELSSGGEFE